MAKIRVEMKKKKITFRNIMVNLTEKMHFFHLGILADLGE